jgi:hypothetical protein
MALTGTTDLTGTTTEVGREKKVLKWNKGQERAREQVHGVRLGPWKSSLSLEHGVWGAEGSFKLLIGCQVQWTFKDLVPIAKTGHKETTGIYL